jgi:hypothetical protein
MSCSIWDAEIRRIELMVNPSKNRLKKFGDYLGAETIPLNRFVRLLRETFENSFSVAR